MELQIENVPPPNGGGGDHGDREAEHGPESAWVLIGLVAVVMSTLVVEIALTKFFAYKVDHHFTYAVLSLVILGFGGSGVYVYLRPEAFDQLGWARAARYGAYYAVSLILAVLIFCWIPLDPYNESLPAAVRAMSLPIYFLLFTAPFFFAGVCVSYTLIASKRAISRIYFWDLLAAAVGAALCPLLLREIGGFGTILLAAGGGMLTYYAFRRVEPGLAPREPILWSAFIVSAAAILWYPDFARDRYGFDIRSTKDTYHRVPFLEDFGGMQSTYWNAISRIDVSHVGNSAHEGYNYGLATRFWDQDIPGRYILQDGGANTRQFEVTGDVRDQVYLGEALWASPYILRPQTERVLVIGGGGGIDILEAKYFNAVEVDVAELNRATTGIITGTIEDPERARFLPWLVSDEHTKVTVHHAEGRHFATTRPDESYDVVQASGVDTLTAVTSGGKSLVENYLYTIEGVEEFMRVLKPDGILSLTHWRTSPPKHNLRMFLTFLEALERAGVREAHRQVVVVAGPTWTDTMLSKEPFGTAEIERLREWVASNDRVLLFDPLRPGEPPTAVRNEEEMYWALGNGTSAQRDRLLSKYVFQVSPVVDDRPYFYQLNRVTDLESAFISKPILNMFLVALLASVLLVGLPVLRIKRGDLSRWSFQYAAFFAIAGFAFMLFQTTIIQLFAVFVGGPIYSLAVVLVAVLGGYSVGSWIAGFLEARRTTFIVTGAATMFCMGAVYFFSSDLLALALPWQLPARLALCGTITFVISLLTGIPVPLAMSAVRLNHGSVVGWMWGISSAFNVLGAMSFVPLTQLIGISSALLIAAGLYLLAGFAAAFSPLVSGRISGELRGSSRRELSTEWVSATHPQRPNPRYGPGSLAQ